jgi:hypothetical protein
MRTQAVIKESGVVRRGPQQRPLCNRLHTGFSERPGREPGLVIDLPILSGKMKTGKFGSGEDT